MQVSWDDDIPNIWKHKKCSKPPTRLHGFSGFVNHSYKSTIDVESYRRIYHLDKHVYVYIYIYISIYTSILNDVMWANQ